MGRTGATGSIARAGNAVKLDRNPPGFTLHKPSYEEVACPERV